MEKMNSLFVCALQKYIFLYINYTNNYNSIRIVLGGISQQNGKNKLIDIQQNGTM